ncbi:ARM repeat superfamily protein [Tasmannia lanceolata]|uniref:ARM repeat superfamily protein n=1 Tax=Tasmannia lanceolata TaxID=3420 RepID=UPI0040644AAC
MALRSLDNSLPLSPERPKKVAKIAGTIRNPPDSCINDENTVPTTVADSVIDYIASEDLKALTDPKGKIQDLLEELDSKDWTKVCHALNDARRLALHHSSLLLPILDNVMLVLVKAMKNPRSALIKTSVMASTDMFRTFGHLLLSSPSSDAFNHLLVQLLLKASQDKKFVCEEAEKALLAMSEFVPPVSLLQKLQSHVKHSNLKVRAKAAVSISHCVSKMAIEEMKEFGLVPLLRIAADLLNDRLPEAREAARSIGNSIYSILAGDDDQKMTGLSSLESWQSFCSSNLQPISAQAMIKIIPQ